MSEWGVRRCQARREPLHHTHRGRSAHSRTHTHMIALPHVIRSQQLRGVSHGRANTGQLWDSSGSRISTLALISCAPMRSSS
jgi:hypothetical protein